MPSSGIEPIVVDRGPGEPIAAIVGSIHGDEPSGARAIERILDALEDGELSLDGGVRFIIANPPALDAGVRFLDTDLNRTFPGDAEGNREERLAAAIERLIEGLPTLSIHTTQSQAEPMAFVHPDREEAFRLARRLPIPHLIYTNGDTAGTLTERGEVVSIEAGRQGTPEAIDAAEALSRAFLVAVGALEGVSPEGDPALFVLEGPIDKPPSGPYAVLVRNFEHVDAGQPFATAGDETLVATESFYPVLLSPHGYTSIFGFKARKIDDTAQ